MRLYHGGLRMDFWPDHPTLILQKRPKKHFLSSVKSFLPLHSNPVCHHFCFAPPKFNIALKKNKNRPSPKETSLPGAMLNFGGVTGFAIIP